LEEKEQETAKKPTTNRSAKSALMVLLIHGLIAIFVALFLTGIRRGLIGIIGLDVILIIL
jgi:hypothetical protein